MRGKGGEGCESVCICNGCHCVWLTHSCFIRPPSPPTPPSPPLQEFWSPTSPIQNTIILLIEKIVVAMGDELKLYIPRMVQPVLRLFMQDQSEMKMATQKVSMPAHHTSHCSLTPSLPPSLPSPPCLPPSLPPSLPPFLTFSLPPSSPDDECFAAVWGQPGRLPPLAGTAHREGV